MGRAAATAVLSVLLATGCGSGTATTSSVGQPGSGGPPAPAATLVTCGASRYDAGELAAAPGASSLPAGPATAVDDVGAPAFDPQLDWHVVHEDEVEVQLVRELEQPLDDSGGGVPTHESRTLERITGASNVPDGAWRLMSAGPCVQRTVLPEGLGAAGVTLAATPSPGATALPLLVREVACASGQPADGRVQVVELAETAAEVRLRIAVEQARGDQTCPGNPATPFTVHLGAPLGDREVVDSSVLPLRPLAVGDPG